MPSPCHAYAFANISGIQRLNLASRYLAQLIQLIVQGDLIVIPKSWTLVLVWKSADGRTSIKPRE